MQIRIARTWAEFSFVLGLAGAIVFGFLFFSGSVRNNLPLGASPAQNQPLYKIGVFSYSPTVRSVVAEFKVAIAKQAVKDGIALRYVNVDFPRTETGMGRAIEIFRESGVDIIVTGQTAAIVLAEEFPETPVIAAYAIDMELAEKTLIQPARQNIVFIDAESPENSGKRLRYLHRILPDAKTVLVIRNTDGEPFANPEPMTNIMGVAAEYGMTIVEKQFSSREELNRFFLSYDFSSIDAIFRYTDTFISENIDIFFAMLNQPEIRKPFIVRNRYELARGGILSFGFDTEEFGIVAADTVIKILTQKAVPSEISIIRPGKSKLGLNKDVAELFNVSIPEELLREADVVIE